MIKATFDIHELLYSIEGFARGSHLRQHIWQKVFVEYLPQLSEIEQDFLWFFMRRDLWDLYFRGKYGSCGKEDFLRCMAALHRGNRAMITCLYQGEESKILCYRYQGHWCPFDKGFNAHVADEYITNVSVVDMPYNRSVELGKEDWWRDLSVYDKDIRELLTDD